MKLNELSKIVGMKCFQLFMLIFNKDTDSLSRKRSIIKITVCIVYGSVVVRYVSKKLASIGQVSQRLTIIGKVVPGLTAIGQVGQQLEAIGQVAQCLRAKGLVT